MDNHLQAVKDYYGKSLHQTKDLKTSAYTVNDFSCQRQKVEAVMKMIHEKIKERYFGCGIIAPDALKGQHILDLGCGAGMDSFILAQMVGPNGYVIGVDMTEELLEVAREYIDYHKEAFGYSKANTEFHNAYIENLTGVGICDNSQDILTSNGVINLTPDKKAVLKEAFRVMKNGGELHFNDVYCDKRISEDMKKDQVLWGECIAGALYWKDLLEIATGVGFTTPMVVESTEMAISSPDIQKLTCGYKFVYVTYRMFKLSKNKQSGSVNVTYKGGIEFQEDIHRFSANISFQKGKSVNVPAEIGSFLSESRFKDFFQIGKFESQPSEISLVVDPFAEGVMAPAKCGCSATKENNS